MTAIVVAVVLLAAGAATAQQLKPSELKVEFATADGIRFTRPTPDFRQEIFLQSPAGSVPIGVSITPFVSVEGTQIPVTITAGGAPLGSEVKTPDDGRLTLVVNAVLPSAGVYTSYLSVSSKGFLPLTVPVIVTRTRAALAVAVRDLVTAEARPWSGGHVDFTILESTGHTARFQLPQLVAIARQLPGDKQIQASTGDGLVERTDVATVTMIGDRVATEADGLIELPGGRAQRFRATVTSFDSAGEYAGVVRVSSPVASSIEEKAWLLVRHSQWVCFGLILLGAAVSYVLQLWYKKLRPRMDRLRRAESLREELTRAVSVPHLDPAARALLDGYRTRADTAYAQIEADNGDAADRVILDIERKLPLVAAWSTIRTQVNALRPVELGDAARLKLSAVEAVLRRGDATAEDVLAQARELEDLPGHIATVVRDRVRAELTKLEAALTERIEQHGVAGLEGMRSEARAAAGLEDASAALARLMELWTEYAQVLIVELRATIAGARPSFVSSQSWLDAQTRIGRLLDGAAGDSQAAYEGHQKAHRAYLETLVKGLAIQKASLADRVSKVPDSDADAAAKREAYAALSAAIDTASARVSEGMLDRAAAHVSEAAREVERLNGLFPAPQKLGGAAGLPDGRSMPAHEGLGSIAAAFGFTPAWTPLIRPRPASRRFRDLMNRWDFAATAAIAAVASVMGLMTLWNVNPTWGSAADMWVALLWGLGLHGVTFTGLSALTDRFKTG
jgi:hypothetical protein